jgi:GntR family histidine utilization transcriptional repressor
MTAAGVPVSWQAVRDAVLARIRAREWAPGERIPDEAELARSFGCARTTVNRALRELAGTGLIERRRRAGTRVAASPVRRARLDIPVLRDEIARRGQVPGFVLLDRIEGAAPPPAIRGRMGLAPGAALLHVLGLHTADGRPHAIEDRWIDPAAAPGAGTADFTRTSPNEWLVANIPFEGGDIAFSAATADAGEARLLGCAAGDALFVTERTTWRAGRALTAVRLVFAPGYRVQTRL